MASEGSTKVKVEYNSREELDKFISSLEDIQVGISKMELKMNNSPVANAKPLQQQLSTLQEQLAALQKNLTPPNIVVSSVSLFCFKFDWFTY